MTLRVKPARWRNLDPAQTDVFMIVRRLINEWADDSDMLAVVAWAYERVLGYDCAAFEIRREGLRHDDALDLVNRALYRRNRRTLQHRAEGLVLALRSVASDVEAARLHRVRLDVAVIECRELSIEERLAKLREMSAE
jgi:hypothetical protein